MSVPISSGFSCCLFTEGIDLRDVHVHIYHTGSINNKYTSSTHARTIEGTTTYFTRYCLVAVASGCHPPAAAWGLGYDLLLAGICDREMSLPLTSSIAHQSAKIYLRMQ